MMFEPVVILIPVTTVSSSNADFVLCSPRVTTYDKLSHSHNSRAFLVTIKTVMHENVSCMDLLRGHWCRVSRIRLVAMPRRQIILLKDKEEASPRILFYTNNGVLILKEVTAESSES
jgi:hypothetical protein